jgi:hypothetical protein
MHRLLFVLLLLFTLVACGGDPPATDSTGSEGEAATDSADSTPPPAASASASGGGDDACAVLTAAEVVAALGADVSSATQEAGKAADFGAGNNSDCNTTVVHEGVETTATLLVRSKVDATPPDAWAQQIQDVLENGQQVGNQTYTYEAATLGGFEAALSDIHGGTFVRIRTAMWRDGEELIYRLTLSTTLVGDAEGDPPTPSPELFGQLIEATMN